MTKLQKNNKIRKIKYFASSKKGMVRDAFSDVVPLITVAKGAEVPFLRPAALARSSSPLWKVVAHSLSEYEKKGKVFDLVVLLSCTTPFTKVLDVRRALKLEKESAKAVASVVAEKGPLSWRFVIKNKQLSKDFSSIELFNASLHPCPKLNDYAKEICYQFNISNKFLSIPKRIVIFMLFITSFITKNLKSNSNFSYIRLSKLFRSNFIKPSFLLDKQYIFKYGLNASMKDWKKNNPSDWI